eukprot:scaffold161318_cov34-Tisochrysis_lutea.AAC.4
MEMLTRSVSTPGQREPICPGCKASGSSGTYSRLSLDILSLHDIWIRAPPHSTCVACTPVAANT